VALAVGHPVNLALCAEAEWIWKSWPDSDDWILFHPPSRQTHRLDQLSAYVLKLLRGGSQSPEQLAECLVRDFDLEPEAQCDAVKYVATLLLRLAELGLISGSAP
jgi:PqqD family protein of HPr-rel-A system